MISDIIPKIKSVDEKADMERTSRGAAAYKVIEEIRDYSQLGLLNKELQQQIFMSNMIVTSRQQTQSKYRDLEHTPLAGVHHATSVISTSH